MSIEQRLRAASEDAREMVRHVDVPSPQSRRSGWMIAVATGVAVFLVGAVGWLLAVSQADDPHIIGTVTSTFTTATSLPPTGMSGKEACDLLIRSAGPWPLAQRRGPDDVGFHGNDWGAAGCSIGWDDGYDKLHFFTRVEATSSDQARQLLGQDLLQEGAAEEWVEVRPGVWTAAREQDERSYGAVAVSDDPRFFVVTYLDIASALAVADAVVAEMRGTEEPTAPVAPVDPANTPACDVLVAASAPWPLESPSSTAVNREWGGGGCAIRRSGYWDDLTLLTRFRETTSIDQAEQLLTQDLLPGVTLDWAPAGTGVWTATFDNEVRPFGAVAISKEPYFFVVTYRDVDSALAVAEAVRALLGDT